MTSDYTCKLSQTTLNDWLNWWKLAILETQQRWCSEDTARPIIPQSTVGCGCSWATDTNKSKYSSQWQSGQSAATGGRGGGRVSHRNNVRYLNIITKCITAELFVIITLCTSVDYINTCTRKLISCFIEPEHILRCFHRTVSAVTREWIFPAAAFVWSSQMQACKSTKYRTPSQHHTVQYTARSLTGTAELDN